MSGAFDPERIFVELTDKEVDYVVIGGIAATLHGAARPTQDVDVLIDRKPANLARVAAALEGLDARLKAGEGEPITVSLDAERLRLGMNFSWATAAGDLDTFGEVEGGFVYATVVDRAWEAVTSAGTTILVVSLADLIAMKRASGRPKDQLALLELTELEGLAEGK